MATPFRFKLITPQKLIYDGDVESISTKTAVGEIGIYARHIPLVGIIPPSTEVLIKAQQELKYNLPEGGVLSVQQSTDVVITAAQVE
jgi:F-type H+-transporting ATPase subunit epsilon